MKTIYDAVIYAIKMHYGQKRKDGSDYIEHPLRVAGYLKQKGYDEKYQIVGLFHDLLEDTAADEDFIAEYGDDILKEVKLLSKNYSNNTEEYIRNILNDPIAKEVKNADRIDNIKDALKINKAGFKASYLKNSKDYYYGKFSSELDELIAELEDQVNAL